MVDKAKEAERARQYRLAHPEKVNERNRRYRKTNPEWARRMRRRYKLRYSYGLTEEEFDALYESQGGICAIRDCGRPIEVVDHDHATGMVRGLLCGNCNKALGLLGEDSPRIRGLSEYLEAA